MAEKVVLNAGQEIEGATISRAMWNRGLALIRIPGNDIVQATILFGNSQNTNKMIHYYSVYKDTYTGYTIINSISINKDDNVIEIWITGDGNEQYEHGYTIPDEYIPRDHTVETTNEEEINQNGPESDDGGTEN